MLNKNKNPLIGSESTKLSSNQKLIIDTSIIIPWEFHDRPDAERNNEKITELANSIKKSGQLQPILVRPASAELKSKGIEYELIFGCRRWEACKKYGMKVEAVVKNISNREAYVLMDVENDQSEDISPMSRNKAWASAFKYEFREYAEMAFHYNKDPKQIARGVKAGMIFLTPVFMEIFTEDELIQESQSNCYKLMESFSSNDKIERLEADTELMSKLKSSIGINIRFALLFDFEKEKGDKKSLKTVVQLDGVPIKLIRNSKGIINLEMNKSSLSQPKKVIYKQIGMLLDEIK